MKKRNALIPGYAWLPLIALTLVALLTYWGTRLFSQELPHCDLSLPIDGKIPFVPAFSVIYVLAYFQWVIGFILIARDSRELCYTVLTGEIVSKLICAALFILIPTTMVRAEVNSSGIFSDLVRWLYAHDAADNLFPSIHCLDSLVCLHGAMRMKRTGKWLPRLTFPFTLLVFASTVLIKQHVLVDILAGILVCEIGQFVSRRTPVHKLFARMNARLFHIT